jgi:hypothetical protein
MGTPKHMRGISGGSDEEDVKLLSHWMITSFEAGGRDAWKIAVTMSAILQLGQQKARTRSGLWLPDERKEAKEILNQTLDFFLRMVQQQLHYLKRDNPNDTFSFSSLTESNIWKIADNFAKHVTKPQRSPNANLIYSYTRSGYEKLNGFLRYQTDDDAPDRGFSKFIKEHSDVIMNRKQNLKVIEKVHQDCRQACTSTRNEGTQFTFEPRVAMNECLQLCRTPSTETQPNPLYRNCRKETVGCTPTTPRDWNADRYKENDLDKLMRVDYLSFEANRAQRNWEGWWAKTFNGANGANTAEEARKAIESLQLLVDHIVSPAEYEAIKTEQCRSGYIEDTAKNGNPTRKKCLNKKRIGVVDGFPESHLGLFYHRACMAHKMAQCKKDHLHHAACSATCTATNDDGFVYARNKNPFSSKIPFAEQERKLLYASLYTDPKVRDDKIIESKVVGPGDATRFNESTWETAKETCRAACTHAVIAETGVSLPFGKQPGVADEIATRHCKTLCDTNPFKKSNEPDFLLHGVDVYARLYTYETDPNRLHLAQKTKGVAAKAVQYTTMFLSFASFWFSLSKAVPLFALSAAGVNPAVVAMIATSLLILLMMRSGVIVEDAIKRLQLMYDYIQGNPSTLKYLGWTLKYSSLLVSTMAIFAPGGLLVRLGITVALGGAATLGGNIDLAIHKEAGEGVAEALIRGFRNANLIDKTKKWSGVIALIQIAVLALKATSVVYLSAFYLVILVLLYYLGTKLVTKFSESIEKFVVISSNSLIAPQAPHYTDV